jgi:hypothetical protein
MRNVLCNVEILYTCLKIVFYVVTAIPPEWYFSCCKKPRWRSFKNFAWFSTQCFRKNLCLPILFKKKRTYFLTPLSSQYVQDIVDEVNRKYEERRGKKAGMDWTMYGVHI